MIKADKRNAIYLLNQEGMSIREISRSMSVNTKTVCAIIAQKGIAPDAERNDKINIDIELLRRLYNECNGYVERIYEKLVEEEGVKVGYSTLTRMIRSLEIGKQKNKRCDQVPDKPGEEMQNDTSQYNLLINNKTLKVIGCLLYYRYSKQKYLKFYRAFNRFKMKCFFHEALTFYGYSAATCIIDNTNLARLRGTGKNAIMAPEMEHFAKQYGFQFICHELGHANRKAGNERSFYTVETNFFPGRKFESMEDLNNQAFEWSTNRMANRPVAKTNLIPAKAFEYEKPYLNKLSAYIPAPHLEYSRVTDEYGYLSFGGNYYWVPGTKRFDVKILEYSNCLKLYYNRKLMAEYQLPAYGMKNEKFVPTGITVPKYNPHNRHRPTELEENKLRVMSEEVSAYMNFALKGISGKEKHNFIRRIFLLSKKIVAPVFIKTMTRALKYRITNIKTIERIVLLQITDGNYDIPFAETDEAFKNRESYIEGCITDDPDLNIYNKLLEDKNG